MPRLWMDPYILISQGDKMVMYNNHRSPEGYNVDLHDLPTKVPFLQLHTITNQCKTYVSLLAPSLFEE